MKKQLKNEKTIFLIIFMLFIGIMPLFSAGTPEYTTSLNTTIIKDYLNSGNSNDEKEGIYIQYGGGSNPYLLAIIKNDDGYEAIYLSGPGGSDWNEGDVKATFRQSGNRFPGTWYSRSGLHGDNAEFFWYDSYFVLREGTFIIDEHLYVKIFPYARGFARDRGVQGTGFLLNREGYIVTNYHVINNANYYMVRGINGDFSIAYPYTVVITDEYNDIAILRPEVTSLRFSDPPYSFRTSEAPQGSSVFALGYPMRATLGDEIKLTDGIISALSGYGGRTNNYQTTATVSPGNSGGPLFDENGDVIGINSSIMTGENHRNVNYALKIRHVVDLIEYSNLNIRYPRTNRSNTWGVSTSLAERTARVRNFVYMIEVF